MRAKTTFCLTLLLVATASAQVEEARQLTSRPMNLAAGLRLLRIYESGDASARAYLASRADEVWSPFLAYAARLPGSWLNIQDLRVRVGKATGTLAAAGNTDAVRALTGWAGQLADLEEYPLLGRCGNGAELPREAWDQLEGVDTGLLVPLLSSSDIGEFYGAAVSLKKRAFVQVKAACFGQLKSKNEMMRRRALHVLTEMECSRSQIASLGPYLDDPSRVTRLLIGSELPDAWIEFWREKPAFQRPILVRVAMALKGQTPTDDVLADPCVEVASRGLLRTDGSAPLFAQAARRTLSSGPFPRFDARELVEAMQTRLGPESLIVMALESDSRLTCDLANLISFKRETGAEGESLRAGTALRTAKLFDDFKGDLSWSYGMGPFNDWKPFIDQLLQSKFPSTRAFAYVTLLNTEEVDQPSKDRYTKLLLAERAPELETVKVHWHWGDMASRRQAYATWLDKQPREALLDELSMLGSETLDFCVPLYRQYSKSSDPQVSELARLKLDETIERKDQQD